jgi:RimJ/RimL family protein N-acetyltransferase
MMLPLHTPRLLLRRFADTDLDALVAYRNDPEVARYQSWSSCTPSDARYLIAENKNLVFGMPDEWMQVAIALQATNQIVGDLAVKIHGHASSQAVLGFTIARDHQRCGFAREAVSCMLDILFFELNLHRVSADCDPRNLASWGLMTSLGMQREAYFRQNLWFKGEWADEYVYAILRAEWVTGRTPPHLEPC